MRATYTFEATNRTNIFLSCPRCNSIHSVMMRQTEPETDTPYHVECRKCHLEGDDAPTEAGAEQAWVKTVATYNGEEWHGEV